VAEPVAPPPPPPPTPPAPVTFDAANIVENSLLRRWVDLLLQHPEVELVRIEVAGGQRARAAARVQAVKAFLVGAGVDPERIEEGGYVATTAAPHLLITIVRIGE